ncbi:SusC/RagA family TonB-linked outer membrane protein [Mucilaginibacter sp. cycad4]|uniref:SusC/RagA family TonB-linked outer membrane protein n=1 Tax=Mucilaginibacter sp. cycad4 TaxID=3342096 RepID=UPI002AABED4C|nr:SusC/RagA family TonB-linked outer membrane protein [Mucilaginibacter gossypii]WPV02458.1 SusC/RagA family TonB-linked outer membrane protein [Mucilaginibacter gossypii]
MKFFNHPVGVHRPWVSQSLNLCKFALAGMVLLNMQASAAEAPKAKAKSNINFNLNFAKLTGKVVDEKGEPLVGVSIRIKGTTTGTQTDANGNFTLDVQPNTVLTVSYIGYGTKEVAVGGKSTITITLNANTNLNEVVVTALGIKKESKKLGYAVTTVKGDLLDKAKESNIAYSLEGRVAGLSISGVNGGPGSSARILLRGVTSGGAGSPLFVINGVPMDNTTRGTSGEWGGADYGDGISNINPDDVETMTVLKGQSASALYGARAANGVILITTKSGKKNSGFGVEFNSNFQADQPVNNQDFQTTYGQGEHGVRPANVAAAVSTGNLGWGEKLDGKPTIQFDGKMYPYSNKSNYLDFYRTGNTFTNTASFDGGNETGAFRLSLSNAHANAIVPNSGLDRKTFNLNANQNVTDKLNIAVVANYLVEDSKNRPSLSDGPGNPNNILFLAANEDQAALKPGSTSSGAEQQWNNDIYVTNPYFAANNFINNTGRKRLITSLTARYDITKWIYAQGRIGYDNINDSRFKVTPTGTAYSSNGAGGLDEQSTAQQYEINYDVLFGVKHDIVKDLLSFDFTGGGNIRKNSLTSTSLSGGPFILPYFYSYSNLQTKNAANYTFNQREVHSAYYTADFSIKNYLILSTTGRYDTYSTLYPVVVKGNGELFTPSAAASFIFSEFTHLNWLDFGKLRVSYAKTSGEPLDTYITQQYYNINNPVNGTVTGGFSNVLPNYFLKPFTLTETEIGTELKFLNGRAGLDFAYFRRKTKNDILKGTLDVAAGYGTRYIGTQSFQNNGVEVELRGTPVQTSSFSWSPSINFTYVKNKVLTTDDLGTTQTLGTYRPLNANLAFVPGLPGPQIMATDFKRNASGQIIFDSNGLPESDGVRTPHGTTVPKIYGGLNNDFSFKHINLSFLVDYRFGNKILSATNYYSMYRGLNKATLPGREGGVVGDGVTEDGQKNTKAVDAETYYQAQAQRVSAMNVLDGSFIKLRQVTLGYTFTKGFLTGTPFSGIAVSLVGRNLWTIMKHTNNIDPESGFANSVAYAGIEGTSLPSVRTYGINVNFKLKK